MEKNNLLFIKLYVHNTHKTFKIWCHYKYMLLWEYLPRTCSTKHFLGSAWLKKEKKYKWEIERIEIRMFDKISEKYNKNKSIWF